MNLTPPEPLASYHSITDFSCGITSLDDWLKRRAYANQASGATRTFVTCVDNRVVGYYALASGAISIQPTFRTLNCHISCPPPET